MVFDMVSKRDALVTVEPGGIDDRSNSTSARLKESEAWFVRPAKRYSPRPLLKAPVALS
jgi:hypothetical protein